MTVGLEELEFGAIPVAAVPLDVVEGKVELRDLDLLLAPLRGDLLHVLAHPGQFAFPASMRAEYPSRSARMTSRSVAAAAASASHSRMRSCRAAVSVAALSIRSR